MPAVNPGPASTGTPNTSALLGAPPNLGAPSGTKVIYIENMAAVPADPVNGFWDAALSNAVAIAAIPGTDVVILFQGQNTYKFANQFPSPATGPLLANQPQAGNITLRGTSGGMNGANGFSSLTTGGTQLDFQYAAGSSSGKILANWLGRLTFEDVTLTDSTGSGGWLCWATLTTIIATKNVVCKGKSGVTGSSCTQDAFNFGGTIIPGTGPYTPSQIASADFYAQGYGTNIEGVTFDSIRQGVRIQSAANSYRVVMNCFNSNCGSASATKPPIQIDGSPASLHVSYSGQVITLAFGSGTAINGEIVTANLSGGTAGRTTATYTIATGNSLSTIATGLTAAINAVWGGGTATANSPGAGQITIASGFVVGNTTVNNYVAGVTVQRNLIELTNYAAGTYGVDVTNATMCAIGPNDNWDSANVGTILRDGAFNNLYIEGFDAATPVLDGNSYGLNAVINTNRGGASILAGILCYNQSIQSFIANLKSNTLWGEGKQADNNSETLLKLTDAPASLGGSGNTLLSLVKGGANKITMTLGDATGSGGNFDGYVSITANGKTWLVQAPGGSGARGDFQMGTQDTNGFIQLWCSQTMNLRDATGAFKTTLDWIGGYGGSGGGLRTSSPFQPVSANLASLPTASSYNAGFMAYARNGRKSGEGAGAGTGIMVWTDGTNWRTFYDNSVALS